MDNKDKMIVCPKCGTRIMGGIKVCSVCGHTFDNNVPNNNEEYSQYIREHSDKSSNKDAIGLGISSMIAMVVAPVAFFFTVGWFFFGGLSGPSSNFWTTLIVGLSVLIGSILIPFIFIFRLAKKDSSSKDKKIFAIGMLLLVIAIILFYFLYMKR